MCKTSFKLNFKWKIFSLFFNLLSWDLNSFKSTKKFALFSAQTDIGGIYSYYFIAPNFTYLRELKKHGGLNFEIGEYRLFLSNQKTKKNEKFLEITQYMQENRNYEIRST